jgi:hypothetical protein
LLHAEGERYDGTVITRGIREYMSRDWDRVRRAKDEYWGERITRLGPREGFRIGEELRRQALSLDPRWPSPDDRRLDFEAHVRLAELLHRASPIRRR